MLDDWLILISFSCTFLFLRVLPDCCAFCCCVTLLTSQFECYCFVQHPTMCVPYGAHITYAHLHEHIYADGAPTLCTLNSSVLHLSKCRVTTRCRAFLHNLIMSRSDLSSTESKLITPIGIKLAVVSQQSVLQKVLSCHSPGLFLLAQQPTNRRSSL